MTIRNDDNTNSNQQQRRLTIAATTRATSGDAGARPVSSGYYESLFDGVSNLTASYAASTPNVAYVTGPSAAEYALAPNRFVQQTPVIASEQFHDTAGAASQQPRITAATFSARAQYDQGPSSSYSQKEAGAGIPMARATPIFEPVVKPSTHVIASIGTTNPSDVQYQHCIVVEDNQHQSQPQTVGNFRPPERQRRGAPPFCRPDRAELLQRRTCFGLFSLPDRYPVLRNEHEASHWTHAKAASEVLTDLEWTDEEAREVATDLRARSLACFWSLVCGCIVLGFIVISMLGIQLDKCSNRNKNCQGDAVTAMALLISVLSAFVCLHCVGRSDKKVTRFVDRAFREDGSRYDDYDNYP